MKGGERRGGREEGGKRAGRVREEEGKAEERDGGKVGAFPRTNRGRIRRGAACSNGRTTAQRTRTVSTRSAEPCARYKRPSASGSALRMARGGTESRVPDAATWRSLECVTPSRGCHMITAWHLPVFWRARNRDCGDSGGLIVEKAAKGRVGARSGLRHSIQRRRFSSFRRPIHCGLPNSAAAVSLPDV